ncbi:TetR/AcrR family transcriptional regulator [Streptomyces halstedii]|uniref:TetR/AcrR family transcriptional regulator n=1 Tax=Streptomyces TaxID=1883 RepID=UPI00048BF8CF|nr:MULTISPECIES: TetR/AcrR family transcriptional regulator [Streptomyces]MYQ55567.1 TetR family transcriptional regulator [Streptomyces sp. SID4941]MYR76124.1 TetR family transcriptional regulator [Streptomyces sp. SID4925]MYY16773.1 TetR family transcriptional regulator [Streptomyces sp. SID4912]WSX35853.1 TetR/AcrR family transcriptional regulator [Streptomyces halstedii]KDQ69683.1 TetR family transcriptional regulator [Streptomyces sp. NTK 937]
MAAEARRGYAKGRAKRGEILDQAMALFGEAGYRGASLRVIATRCGISHPGLLHHFPTKESLLLAVLEHRDEVDGEWLDLGGTTGVQRLRGFAALAELNATRRGIVELFSVVSAEATSADHPAHAYFVRRYAHSVSGAELAYVQAREEGALRDGVDPALAGAQLIALMDGLQVQWLLSDGATDMAGVLRAHLQAQLTVRL